MKKLYPGIWQPGEGWLSFLDWGWSRDEKMSRIGNELFQAGQDSLLEQMETPWVNRFAPKNTLAQNPIVWTGGHEIVRFVL